MALPDVPLEHLIAANTRSRVNLIHNGGFTAYPGGLTVVEDTSTIRKGGDPTARRFDLVDARLYRPVTASIAIPAASGGPSILGHWDLYGGPGSVEIAPVDGVSGAVIRARDGGNLARVSFTGSGTVTLSQVLTDPTPVRGNKISFQYTGRSFSGQVKVTSTILADGEEVLSTVNWSQTFGIHRRPGLIATVPETAKQVEVRLTLTAGAGAALGLSGVTCILGPSAASDPFVPSIVDLLIPSGTVMLWSGDMCPPGYRDVPGSDERLALLTSGPANRMSSAGVVNFNGGQDQHDHNPQGASDALVAPLDQAHETDTPLPYESTTAVHGVTFGSQDQYPGEKPVTAVGVEHTHLINTVMTAVPPSFPVRFCVKI